MHEFLENTAPAAEDDSYSFDILDDIKHYDTSESDSVNTNENKEETVIFQESKLTVSAAMILILTFSIRFSLSATAISNLLLFIHLMLPKSSSLCKTLRYFRKHFQSIKTPTHYHHYCNNCFFKVADHSLQNCPKCEYDLLVNGNKGYFIEFTIINQIISFFKRVGFYESLQYKFKQNRRSTGNIEDIYDGLFSEKHFKNYGFLVNPDNISFLWNTDGVPLFKSSKISIWPIFLIINELEPSLRFKRRISYLLEFGIVLKNQKQHYF